MPLAIAEPLKLPSGLELSNRLVKASMAETMADPKDNLPKEDIAHAYSKWAQGGWGLIMTGNVQVDPRYLGQPTDVATGEDGRKHINVWRQYAEAAQKYGTPAIVQICHPGRQSMRGGGHRGRFTPAIAPSPVPMNLGSSWLAKILRWALFGTPREMTMTDIKKLIQQFANTALLMSESGFAGVELHAAHGYLLTQFLSSKTNHRTDEYGGTVEKRVKIILDILKAIRRVVPSTFTIGIKLNSADHTSAEFEDTIRQIELIVEAGIDFLEISGGTYEDPEMMGRKHLQEKADKKKEHTLAREAFFIDFATQIRKRFPNVILMVTGGNRSRQGAEALVRKAGDLVGFARPAAVNPNFPRLLVDESIPDEEARVVLAKVPIPAWTKWLNVKAIGGGAESTFYAANIRRLAKGLHTLLP